MSYYFMPKSYFLTKATTIRQPPKKWSIKWNFRRPSSSSSSSSAAATTTTTNKAAGNIETLVQPNNIPTTATTLPTEAAVRHGSSGSNNSNGGTTTNAIINGTSSSSGNKKGKFSKFKKFHAKWSWQAGAGGWTILSILDWWLLATGGWFTWSGLLMRVTPLGVTIIAALDWHFHNQRLQQQGLPKTASQLQANVYCSLPLRLFSRCWGWFADCHVPVAIRPYVYGWYSNAFNVNIDEAANPELKNYRSLSEFFTRSLKEGCRTIDKCSLVSPADGKVLHFGSASTSQIEQVKGVSYRIESFLGPANWNNQKNDSISYLDRIKHHKTDKTALFQCVIYLAPGDYHRFHSPAQWEPQLRRHFAGELLSVSPKIATWLPGLFCLNERALYIGKWQHGFFSFTAVGATNVGSVQIYFDDKLKTNKWLGLKMVSKKHINQYDEMPIDSGKELTKGELVGQFNMGSTIVLIFEAPSDFQFSIKAGQTIKVGESLGNFNHENSVQ